jgi:uridylate kinase
MGKQGTDGVYNCDPKTNPTAVMYEELTYDHFLAQNLRVADTTAIAMAREHGMPMVFFNLDVPGNIIRVIGGETLGTVVHS